MANIPGLTGFQQPGSFARDRVISQGVSIPGGTRIPCIMGEGLKEEVLVASATGGGSDGSASCNPTSGATTGSGRFFAISSAPLTSGRTEVYINENQLFGTEDEIDANGFDNKFNFRIDIDTGCLELQGASIGDQDGHDYSASSLNTGTGTIVEGICGTMDLVSVVDNNAPPERWTVKCVSVSRDANGDPIPGLASFTVTGSISGQLVDANGQPILFDSNYLTGSAGAVSGTADPCADGASVANSTSFGLGSAIAHGGSTPLTTDTFQFSGDLVSQGQVVAGDYLCVDGYTEHEIESFSYASGTNLTTVTLVNDDLSTAYSSVAWDIIADDLFVDDPTVIHNGLTGLPASAGNFDSSAVGKILMICSGDALGTYRITAVTSSRRVRVVDFDNSTLGFPTMSDDNADGFAYTNITWHLLQTNEVIQFGILEGTTSFEVGDKFFIDVGSKVLATGDELKVRYIATADLEDSTLFTSSSQLAAKHGEPSATNTLSLGAQMCFENGAPAVLAVQCKPPIPRRTTQTLLAEVDASGDGGFTACGGSYLDCEPDDLIFNIPLPTSGLKSGRPDGDTGLNIFVVRNNEETQIFPNKVAFYNSQYENATGQNTFISSPDTTYSYTVINSGFAITGQGYNGTLTESSGKFSTLEVDFDGDDVGNIIVIQSVENSTGTVYSKEADIALFLFGDSNAGAELIITAVDDDNEVSVVANDGSLSPLIVDGYDAQFYVYDASDTTNVAASLMLHRDLVQNGTLQTGDGIKISYIDQNDDDFFDTNWADAFEALEAEECQIVIPLPLQNRSGIFRAAQNHAEDMSTIAIQKERFAMFGAQIGITPEALLGTEDIAIEDIGILEGIQGDDAEEVLAGNTEDLVDYQLSNNFASNRSVYFWPDSIVRDINGTNTNIDGFYIAAAAAGWLSKTQNVAVPLTFKILIGFSILNSKKLKTITLNQLGGEGVTVLQPVVGGGKILAGRTTSQSGFVEDEEISVMFIRDTVKQTLRAGLRPFVGTVEDANTQLIMTTRVNSLMSGLLSKGLITDYSNIRVERDKVDPRQWNVFVRFQPAYPINYVFIDIEVGVTSTG